MMWIGRYAPEFLGMFWSVTWKIALYVAPAVTPYVALLVPLDDLHRRDAQALLEDLGRVGREAPDRLPADLGEVTDVRHEPEELALVEDGPHDAVLGDVRAAAVGVVVQDDVARLERLDS